MKFVDKATISVKGGNGGPGSTSFRREKYIPFGGPDGGNGGDGGSIIIVATPKRQTLLDLNLKKHYKAKNGQQGQGRNKYGSNGPDLTIEVPCGTTIWEDDTLVADLKEPNETIIIAKGGKGGKGNKQFATPTNRAPRHAQEGTPGEEKELTLELKLIAQVGLVGLPNAGKSTLLKVLTNANPKIADYPFTTLYPNLGVIHNIDHEIILADIPGLIEGASQGQGLGHEFLRHVERTQCLLHIIAATPEDPQQAVKNYRIIQNELKQNDPPLDNKPSIVVLNKIDIMDEETLTTLKEAFQEIGITPLCISAVAQLGLDALKSKLSTTLNEIENDIN